MSKKEKPAELFRLEETTNPAYSVLVEYVYLQPGGCGRWGSHSLGLHTYVISSSCVLKEAVASPYGVCFPVLKRPTPGSGNKGAEEDVSGTSGNNRNDGTKSNDKTYKDIARMKVQPKEAQILLMLRIGKLRLLVYHWTRAKIICLPRFDPCARI